MGKTKKHSMKLKRNGTRRNKRSLSNKHLVPCKKHDNRFEKEYEKSEVFKSKKSMMGINKELNEIFKKFKTPKDITPQNDYFTYINFLWIKQQNEKLKKKEDKKYYVQVDNFRVTQEKVFYQIIDIAKKSKNQKILNLYNSIFNLNQKCIEKNIRETTQAIDGYIASDTLIEFLAYINSNEIVSWGCPVYWKMMADEKNPSKYISHVTSPVMGMYEYELLAQVDNPTAEVKKYLTFYKKKRIENIMILFEFCLGKDHGLQGEDVWSVEYDIFATLGCNEIKTDSPEYYNVLDSKTSLEYGFDWDTFTKSLGYKTSPKTFISSSTNYLKCIMKLMKDNWKSNKWKAYWYYIFLRSMSRFGSKFDHILYGFAGKFVQGQDVMFPRELSPIFALSMAFNTYLTREYSKEYRKEEYVDYVKNLAEDLTIVFTRILKRNTWLSPPTKKYAILKLQHLKLIIGNPEIGYEDPDINYSSTDAWGNMVKIMNWRRDLFVRLDGKPVIDIPYVDWREMPYKLIGKQCYIVNAYYTPIENSIYIPLAYLQPPFIDLAERGIEYNLAHIGFTIGHELSHSLDNIGSKYDYNGKLFDWWLPKDKKIYEFKLQDIVKQYNVFTAYDNIHFDVHMSLSEDLADISGLAICEEYLRDFQDKNDDVAYIRKLSFGAFFCYYAIQARQAIAKKAISAQLKNNPHPLDKYRVNCTLARLELFKNIYEVKKTDKMYWESSDTFWGHD
jgi:putative endopeptidase